MAVLLRDSVYRALRDAILTCEFEPGQELREQILAEKYRVSRSPIRDSLLRLEQDRLVTVLPRQGYRVNPITLQDVEDIYGLRMVIEAACAERAARADDAAVAALDRFRDFTGEEPKEVTFLDYNRAFHRTVADLAANPRLAAVEYGLVEEADRLIRVGLRMSRGATVPELVGEHRALIDSIQAHDAETAFRLAREHVIISKDRIIASLLLEAGLRDPAGTSEGAI